MKTGAAILLVIMSLGAAAFVSAGDRAPAREAVVARAPFAEMLVEPGTITAARMALYGAPVGALPAKILELVPEGTAVEAGDVLVRLDIAALEQLVARESAALRRAEAELAAAAGAEALKLRTERLQLMEAEAALAEADREVARTRAALEDLRPMLAESFITRPEFDRAEQAVLRAEDQRRLAAARRELRADARSEPGVTLRAAGPAALVDELRARLAALQHHIALSTIRAQAPGLVVYRELFFGSERRKPQVGDEAMPNQPLLAVPDASGLIVETRVREIDLHRIAPGQSAAVGVDAYPGLSLEGRVDAIGALAESDATRAGTKYFPVSIHLHDVDPRLRAGMTAQVRIEISSIPSALVVPLEAVFEDSEGTYCLVAGGSRVARRAVAVWARSDTHAAIKSGLNAGERLRLGPDRP